MTKELFKIAAEDLTLPKLDVSGIKGVTPLEGPSYQ